MAAVVLAIIFTVTNRASGIKIIDVTGIVTFLSLAILAFAGSPSITHDVAHYGRGASAVVLAVVMLASTLTTPFTVSYARETVPPAYWNTPEFLAINRRISAAWGGAVLVMAVGHLVGGRLAASAGGESVFANALLNWVLPLLLIFGAVAYTRLAAHGARVPAAPASSPAWG